jgi:hypothetical protein
MGSSLPIRVTFGFSQLSSTPEKAMLEHGDTGAVSAKPGVRDRHPPAGALDHYGRTTIVPLRRRISGTLSAASIHFAGTPVSKAIQFKESPP